MQTAQIKWNRRYTTEGAKWSTREPSFLLADYTNILPRKGIALDAGAGVGKNSIFLAQQGLRVIALDISETGLGFLKRRADTTDLPISPAVWNLAQPHLPAAYFDLVINFNFLERATLPAYRHTLKDNGLIIFSTFVQPTPDHPSQPFFLRPNELRDAFAGFEVLHSSQSSYFHQRSGGVRYVEHFIGRKPPQSLKNQKTP